MIFMTRMFKARSTFRGKQVFLEFLYLHVCILSERTLTSLKVQGGCTSLCDLQLVSFFVLLRTMHISTTVHTTCIRKKEVMLLLAAGYATCLLRIMLAKVVQKLTNNDCTIRSVSFLKTSSI